MKPQDVSRKLAKRNEIELVMEIIENIKNLETETINSILFYLFITFAALIFVVIQKKSNIQLKIILCIISLGSFFIAYGKFNDDVKIKKVKSDFSLTTGRILEYSSGNKKTKQHSIEFYYTVNNILFAESCNENDILLNFPNYKPNEELEYLIIYEKNDPQNGYMLFDYPVSNDTDFKKYEKLFEKGIPNNVFK